MPAIPSTLPPSVEEAYRRKCVQLKNRTNEVEDANDAARLRLARIKRQVEKLRIERAFLLEQLSKRTSTNVEDSDGSPSPPPTNLDGLAELMVNPRKPKDKPLRTKRGHRKSMAVDIESKDAGASFNGNAPQSPASDSAGANGVKSKVPADAFEVFCNETREAVEAKKKDDDDLNVEDELARLWKELSETDKEEFEAKFEKAKADEEERKKREEEEEEEAAALKKSKADEESKESKDEKADKPEDSDKPQTQDEDVEMGNYDTEDQDTQADKADE